MYKSKGVGKSYTRKCQVGFVAWIESIEKHSDSRIQYQQVMREVIEKKMILLGRLHGEMATSYNFCGPGGDHQ